MIKLTKRIRAVQTRPKTIPKEELLQVSVDQPTGSITPLERQALQIALGVLRSDTDYGDFLNFWLQDYGRQILSPNPPPPLLPDMSVEEQLALAIEDDKFYVN